MKSVCGHQPHIHYPMKYECCKNAIFMLYNYAKCKIKHNYIWIRDYRKGKQYMLSYIVGSFFIMLGILFLLYPESLRKRLRKKALRKIRKYLFAGAITLGILLVSTGWQYKGFFPKILALVGIIVVSKGVFFLKSKSADKVTEWILKQPVIFFKIFAACQIILGILIIFELKS